MPELLPTSVPEIILGPLLGIEGEDTYTVVLVLKPEVTKVQLGIHTLPDGVLPQAWDSAFAAAEVAVHDLDVEEKVAVQHLQHVAVRDLDSNSTANNTARNMAVQHQLPHQLQWVAAQQIAQLPMGMVWRLSFQLPLPSAGRWCSYQLFAGCRSVQSGAAPSADVRWQPLSAQGWPFYQPGVQERPKLGYASCNGFSDATLANSTAEPYQLWQAMQQQQALAEQGLATPLSMLLMGGDQVYADALWHQVPALARWQHLSHGQKIKMRASQVMRQQLQRFYSDLYVNRWRQPAMARIFATVPSVMMWDDHDIFDGWGSYPAELQQCEVYRAIFQAAQQHYVALQLRGAGNQSRLAPDADHYSQAFTFRHYRIIALDHRSERRLDQIMSPAHWQAFIAHLQTIDSGDLLLLSAVPVVYRDFSFAEQAVDATPWQEELTDDLKDHWRAREHQGERLRLIMRLLANAAERHRQSMGKTVILSGDVHVGCLGIVSAKPAPTDTATAPLYLHQVVSSGIVHPAPSFMAWQGICAVTNDKTEYLDAQRLIRCDMVTPHSSSRYIRTRNYATLERGTDGKLWVNWICENNTKPLYPLQ